MAKIILPPTLFAAIYANQPIDDMTQSQIDNVGKIAKAMIIKAVEDKIQPEAIKEGFFDSSMHSRAISLPPDIDRPLKIMAKESNVTASSMYQQMLIAAMAKDLHAPFIQSKSIALDKYLTALSLGNRHHQDVLFGNIEDALDNKKCGLVEGATGIGKTLAILSSANERALKSQARVVISVDSIANMSQYLHTYKKLAEQSALMAPLRYVLGKNNFVSVVKLIALMDDPVFEDVKESVNTWLDAGGYGANDDKNLPPYLLSSLKNTCNIIPEKEVTLSHGHTPCAGLEAYIEQFDNTADPVAIILCSHAMLCEDAKRKVYAQKDDNFKEHATQSFIAISKLVEIRSKADSASERKSLGFQIAELIERRDAELGAMVKDMKISFLPHYEHLIVDEAHLLETAMSNAISQHFSFKSTLLTVKELASKGLLSQAAYKATNAAFQKLCTLSPEHLNDIDLAYDDSELKVTIAQFCDGILKAKGIKKCELVFVNEIKSVRKQIELMKNTNQYFNVSYSPIKTYPRAVIGNANTGAFLKTLWNQTTSSCCVSATLYFKKYLEYSAAHFIELLQIPKHKCATYEPIIPKWHKAPIQGFYLPPSIDNGKAHWPVDMKSIHTLGKVEIHNRSQAWQKMVADNIKTIHTSSAGGVLVLMTSYADVSAIYELLCGDTPNVVYANKVQALSSQREQYLTLSKSGKKPIWLALGGAWTGLDINGTHVDILHHEIQEKDNVVTDLVIPKIPFGLNMSLSHAVRKKSGYKGARNEVLDTAIRFKQGVGRLIRLQDQPANRRVFLLDGRIHDPARNGFFTPIKQFINTYPVVAEF